MNIVMTNANVFKLAAWGPCRITRIHGWNNQASSIYIQLLEVPPVTTATAPPTGTIPNVKSFLAQANNGFDYEFGGGISLAELTIGCSSTETTFTPVGANAGLDMTVELDTVYDVRAGDAIIGDLTSAVTNLQVWADASGPKTLLRVDYACADGETTYPQIFCADSPSAGAKPNYQLSAVADSLPTQTPFFFGSIGIVPLGGPSVNTGTARENTNRGCNIYASKTSGSLTVIGGANAEIRAIYGNVTR